MYRLIPLLLFMAMVVQTTAQEPQKHEKRTYVAPDGKLYIQKDLPVYLWLSVDKEDSGEKHRLESEETAAYANPMYFDTEGFNSVRSPSAVDTATHKPVYPLRDIVFEIYADSRHPVTTIDYGGAELYRDDEAIYIGQGTGISLSSSDELSGVEDIYFSLDGSPFKPYSESIAISNEKTYVLKYYAADNVGNAEPVKEVTLVFDQSAPATKHTVIGDQYENIVSGRSKIELTAEDGNVGVDKIYYRLDDGEEKIYTTPLATKYLSQDDHTLVYYAVDEVGNREEEKSFAFYVDKTPPTIIEEIMGKSFFTGGREYSSGKSRLKLTSFDNKAGVKEVRYSVNSGEYEVYDAPVFLTQSSGNLLIRSYAVDNVNNRSVSQTANEKTTIPYIDLTGPELGYAFSGPKFSSRDTTFISKETKILLKANDGEAGLNRIDYSVNGTDPVTYSEPFRIEPEGYSEIDYTGYDNVENTSGGSFAVKIDNTGPEISYLFGTSALRTENGSKVYPAHAVLFLSASDKVVGFSKMTYALNGGSVRNYTGVLSGFPAGSNTLEVVAYDHLGNASTIEIKFIIE